MVLKKNNFLIPQKINHKNFETFGDLIEKPLIGSRTDFIANLQKTDQVKDQSISVTTLEFSKMPLYVDVFERHLHTSQTFFPLDVGRYLIVVAPDKFNSPDEDNMTALIVPGTIGINYYLGTWHSPLQVLDRRGTFAILMYLFNSDLDQQWSKVDKLSIKID